MKWLKKAELIKWLEERRGKRYKVKGEKEEKTSCKIIADKEKGTGYKVKGERKRKLADR